MEKCRGELLKNESLTQEEEMKSKNNYFAIWNSYTVLKTFFAISCFQTCGIQSYKQFNHLWETWKRSANSCITQTTKFSPLHLPWRSQYKANSLILHSDLVQILLMTVDNAYLAADSSCLSAITWWRDIKIPRHLRRDICHCSWTLRNLISLRGVVIWYSWLLRNLESYSLFGNFEFVEDHCFLFGYIPGI